MNLSESQKVMRWRLIIEELWPNIQHIAGVENNSILTGTSKLRNKYKLFNASLQLIGIYPVSLRPRYDIFWWAMPYVNISHRVFFLFFSQLFGSEETIFLPNSQFFDVTRTRFSKLLSTVSI